MYTDLEAANTGDFTPGHDAYWKGLNPLVDQDAMDALPIEPMDEMGYTTSCASKNTALPHSMRDEVTEFGPGCTSFVQTRRRRLAGRRRTTGTIGSALATPRTANGNFSSLLLLVHLLLLRLGGPISRRRCSDSAPGPRPACRRRRVVTALAMIRPLVSWRTSCSSRRSWIGAEERHSMEWRRRAPFHESRELRVVVCRRWSLSATLALPL